MDNRFLPAYGRQRLPQAQQLRRQPRYGKPAGLAGPMWIDGAGLVRAQSSAQRVLVVLIENGGVDLGIPELADKLLAVLPASELLPDGTRQQLIGFLRDTIKKFTDDLLESAELALNRYSGAAPSLYGSVAVLRNGSATHDELRDVLWKHTREDRLIDLLILTHGSDKSIAVTGGASDDQIRRMRADLGRPLALRSVYMMNCVGASLNQAWLDAGARVSSGSIGNNYLPEPTTWFFWQAWQQGQGFEAAVTGAYRKTINAMNDAVRAFVSALPVPGSSLLAGKVEFDRMDFVRDSAPVIQGQRGLTISSDDISFASSLSSSLATTVLPVHVLRRLNASPALDSGSARSFSYHSPSVTTAGRDAYSRMQNPAALAAPIVAASATDAAAVGLSAAAIVQSQINASSGSFTLTYDKAQRLLTADARRRMPGAQHAKTKYQRPFMHLEVGRLGTAEANVIVRWEGNAYGEIGTVEFERDLKTSTDWSRSSALLNITHVERIPIQGVEPRSWPLTYTYVGNFDPLGNGHFEFSGEFEVNAYGGIKFLRHDVVSRSLADWAMAREPEEYVARGSDIVVPAPAIPNDQAEFLKANLP